MSTTADALEAGSTAQAKAAIRQLNDRLRQTGAGGRVMVTAGIDALPEETTALILAAIVSFDAFNEDNDPHGEHDCASLQVAGYDVIWKGRLFRPCFQHALARPSRSKGHPARADDHAG